MNSAAVQSLRWPVFLGVLAVLAAHVTAAWVSTLRRSVTVDEIFHVTGGYFFDRFEDFRIQPENGVLPQRLQALPAVLRGARPPPLENNEYWRTSDMNVVSYQFFYESGNDHWPMLLGARAMNLVFSVALCVLVFCWARALGGNVAGFVALVLAAASPTLLAHGPLATTDVAAAFFLAASAGAFWRQLRNPGGAGIALSAVVFGLACVAKFSAVALLPVFAILIAVDAGTRPRGEHRFGRTALSLAVHAAVALLIIWATYDFRFTAFSPATPPASQFVADWEWMLSRCGWQAGPIRWLRDRHVLPEAFLYGYAHVTVSSQQRAAFLAGEYSTTGWRSFFPLAFWWKSTPAEIAVLVLAAIGAGWRVRRIRVWATRLAPLLACGAIYGLAAMFSHLNIGQRHLLPLYPALFIVGGVAVAKLFSRRAVFAAAAVVTGVQCFAAARVFPHELAYFNVFAGGSANGWRLLVDSSLDWGQDLPALQTWLARHNAGVAAEPVFLSYFGSGNPDYYHLHATRMLAANGFKLPLPWYRPEPGIYAISATMLQEVYSPARGPWTLRDEKEYQDLRRLEPQLETYFTDPAARPHLLALASAERWQNAWQRYEILRHARLCAYLRARGPDAMAGYSILIFRLNAAELDAALHTSYSDWLAAIEKAASGRRK